MKTGAPIIQIAYIDQTGEMGGAEHLLLTLLDGSLPATISPQLICAQEGPFPTTARQDDIPTVIIPLPPFYSLSWVIGRQKIFNPLAVLWNLISLIRSAWRVRQYLRTAQIDLVQTNSVYAHIYGGLAARLAGVPCVWYFHDLIERRRLGGTVALVWKLLALCLAVRVVGVSRAVIEALSVGERGCVIYAGYRPQPIENRLGSSLHRQLGLPAQAKLVGYVGRIAHVKALDILAQAARQIIQAEPQVHFVLFGEALFGETGYKQTLLKMIDGMQLTPHWHWLGYNPQAAARIPDMDLLVLPSRREALGLALVEAGLAGKATVGSRIGGIPEIIIHGETGLLVLPERPLELANAILYLLNRPQLARQLGRQAKARVMRVFHPQRYHTEFAHLYASILSKPADPFCLQQPQPVRSHRP